MNANTSTIIMLLLDNGILWIGVPHISREYEGRLDDRAPLYWHVLVKKNSRDKQWFVQRGGKITYTIQDFNVYNIEIWEEIASSAHVF